VGLYLPASKLFAPPSVAWGKWCREVRDEYWLVLNGIEKCWASKNEKPLGNCNFVLLWEALAGEFQIFYFLKISGSIFKIKVLLKNKLVKD